MWAQAFAEEVRTVPSPCVQQMVAEMHSINYVAGRTAVVDYSGSASPNQTDKGEQYIYFFICSCSKWYATWWEILLILCPPPPPRARAQTCTRTYLVNRQVSKRGPYSSPHDSTDHTQKYSASRLSPAGTSGSPAEAPFFSVSGSSSGAPTPQSAKDSPHSSRGNNSYGQPSPNTSASSRNKISQHTPLSARSTGHDNGGSDATTARSTRIPRPRGTYSSTRRRDSTLVSITSASKSPTRTEKSQFPAAQSGRRNSLTAMPHTWKPRASSNLGRSKSPVSRLSKPKHSALRPVQSEVATSPVQQSSRLKCPTQGSMSNKRSWNVRRSGADT